MRSPFQNSKDHWVIPLSQKEVVDIFGGYGICDHCGKPKPEGYLCPVLGHKWYCTECYNDWESYAVNYPEDRLYEEKVLVAMKRVINLYELGKSQTR